MSGDEALELEERIEELEKDLEDTRRRVFYLQKKLDLNVDKERFDRKVSKILPYDHEYEVAKDDTNRYEVNTTIDPYHVRQISRGIQEHEDIDWSVSSSDEENEVEVTIYERRL